MEYFLMWLGLAAIQLAATMSPGPAFVVSMRNAMAHGRMVGIFTALGLAIGVGAHVVFVLMGVSFIIAQSVFLYNIIRYAGAAYLLYIGVKSLMAARKAGIVAPVSAADGEPKKALSVRKAVLTGFLTNLLNPKAVVFFTAIYTQFITPETPFFTHALYGGTSIAIEFLWFFSVSVVLTHSAIRARFVACMKWVEGICGGLMIALGLKLALSK